MQTSTSAYYSAMRAYSKKNGWKLASPAADINDGMGSGSLLGICGSVLRDPGDCLVSDRADEASPVLGRDIVNTATIQHIRRTSMSTSKWCK